MNLRSKTKRVSISLPVDFEPDVSFGSNVEVGVTLGKGTKETTLEYYLIPDNAKVLVDDGVYVDKGEVLLKKSEGLNIMQVVADNAGIVRLSDKFLRIVDLQTESQIKSPVRGKVVLLTKTDLIIETKFIAIPMFMSQGKRVVGDVSRIFGTGRIVSQRNIQGLVRSDIVILSGALTYKAFWALAHKGILSIIAPSVNWDDYIKIFKTMSKDVNLGILQGFGLMEMWDTYKYVFANSPSNYAEVDFSTGEVYIPAYDIMSEINEKIIFKDDTIWARPTNTIDVLENNTYVVRNLGQTYMVNLDEVQHS